MKTLKKALAILLVVAISVSAGILGTIAYFTDTEEEVNVMTAGNVDVVLIEQQRSEDGTALEEYENEKNLMPVVGSAQGTKDQFGMSADIKNYVDKIVRVGNVGSSDAYVRIILGVPAALENDDASKNALHWNLGNRFDVNGAGAYNTVDWNVKGNPYYDQFVSEKAPYGYVEEKGVELIVNDAPMKYNIYSFTYNGPLKKDAETTAALVGFYLDSKVDYDDDTDTYYIGETPLDYDLSVGVALPVKVQAVQADGFDTAEDAFASSFGTDINATELWPRLYTPDYVPEPTTITNGTLALADGQLAAIENVSEPFTLSGEGTLFMSNVKVETTENSAITVAEGSDVKLVVSDKAELKAAANAINVEAGAKLEITGEGALTAIGGNGTNTDKGGSGIGGAGEIYIHDLTSLTAEGYGVAGFGIGGETKSITIENTTIEKVQGGYVQPNFINDTKYGKDEPEGGAAIGSMTNGAVINLNNVTIEEAIGGSKAAAIGARYHTGVTVNITNSTIKNAQGGNASAAIGGSRVSKGATSEENVTINIKNSTITAVGGAYGAGIGSGYDTHCQPNQPVTTIHIDKGCVINATGGKYAAGIGTGYHVAGLAGEIEAGAQITAVSGEKWYKDAYSLAMDVGFGVVDSTREAHAANTSSFNNQGTPITVATLPYK